METSLAELKSILLDLLFLQDTATLPDMKHLGEADWAKIQKMIVEHRLGPMMHWRLTHDCQDVPAPQGLRDVCAKRFKASTMRSLMLQRELRQIHQILESAGIRYVALKGAWLAFHAYPQSGLRPLRDLDILVPENDALRAYQSLLDGGCKQFAQGNANLESVIKLDRHLPPIQSPLGQVKIELHFRLSDLNSSGKKGFAQFADEWFWQRIKQESLSKTSISYLSPAEQLLHLIVHAVYDHQFTNGPLLISDLGYLLQTCSIEWDHFWSLAEHSGYKQGAILALKLLERYWGERNIEWPKVTTYTEQSFQHVLDNAKELILRDVASCAAINRGNRLKSKDNLWQQVTYFFREALFPPRTMISARYPVSSDSLKVYAWYPIRWWKLCSKYLVEYMLAKKQNHWEREVSQLSQLNSWLEIHEESIATDS